MSLGYFDDLADANSYFDVERFVTEEWDVLTDVERSKAIVYAYNRLYYSQHYILPTVLTATATELTLLKKANGEMAYYIILHLLDEDKRIGIEAQGVSAADIVGEKYNGLNSAPMPATAAGILSVFEKNDIGGVSDVARDEDCDVDEDVT